MVEAVGFLRCCSVGCDCDFLCYMDYENLCRRCPNLYCNCCDEIVVSIQVSLWAKTAIVPLIIGGARRGILRGPSQLSVRWEYNVKYAQTSTGINVPAKRLIMPPFRVFPFDMR